MSRFSIKKAAIIIALVIILSIPFFVHPYLIYGDSMYPTLRDGSLVLIESASLRIVGPQRGEVIAHRDPHKKEMTDVKRVVGLPGETVKVEESRVIVTSIEGREVVYEKGTVIGGSGNNGRIFSMKLGPEDYFVLGDNRRTSADSRSFGAVQPSDLIGRIVLRIPSSR